MLLFTHAFNSRPLDNSCLVAEESIPRKQYESQITNNQDIEIVIQERIERPDIDTNTNTAKHKSPPGPYH